MVTSVNEQYIVDEKGNPTAVILPIKDYKKMLSLLGEVEDHRETKILSKSPEFKKEEDPFTGDPIPGWNKEIWKIRVASSDIKKGKRGGVIVVLV